MRKAWLGLCLLAAACGGAGDRSAGEAVEVPAPPANVADAVQTRTPTGLYNGAADRAGDRLCVVESEAGQYRFGLVAASPGGICSGTGRAFVGPGQLTLEMAGNSACRIVAGIDDGRVVFPPTVPSGCSYYCAPGATLAGTILDKSGGTNADALQARDLVGDTLCAFGQPSP